MTRRSLTSPCLLLALACGTTPSAAQEGRHTTPAPAGRFVVTTSRTIRSTLRGAVEEFFVRLRAAEAAAGERSQADVYVLRGADTYVSRREVARLDDAALDSTSRAQRLLTAAFGEREAMRVLDGLAAATVDVATEVVTVAPGEFRDASGTWPVLEVHRSSRPLPEPWQLLEPSPEDATGWVPLPAPPYVRATVAHDDVTTHEMTLLFRSRAEQQAWESARRVSGDPGERVLVLEYRADLSRVPRPNR